MENGDDISLSHAAGKIVMVNEIVRKDLYLRLIKAGVAGFVSISGSPVDEGEDRIPRAAAIPQKVYESLNEKELIQGVGVHYLDAVEMVTRRGKKSTTYSYSRGSKAHLPQCGGKDPGYGQSRRDPDAYRSLRFCSGRSGSL